VGKRFVSVLETKRGVELEEATVKQITGNDTISARAPYGKPFTYRPQFKIWLSTNHKPEIPDGSEAIWDRIRLIPFTQRFEDGKGADPKLPETLRKELPGVLAWAVRGCVDWNDGGLGTSAAVEKAMAKYREETDVINRFFADMCVFGPEQKITKKDLFAAWESWCIDEGVEAGTSVMFTRTMGERGVVENFEEGFVDGKRGWVGISVAKNPPPPPSDSKLQWSKNPWKHEGGGSSRLQLSEDSENFSGQPLTQERFSENGQNLQSGSKVAVKASTTPLRWTWDGVEWEYIPVEESE
jgi:putative DNA primase/helicase